MDNNQNDNRNQNQEQNQNQNGNGQRNYEIYQQNMQNGTQGQQQPPYFQQAPYAQMPNNNSFVPDAEAPMTVKNWLVVLLLMCVPCVNIILLFVWGFDSTPGKKSRANFCKAELIMMCVVFVVYLLFFAVALLAGGELLENLTGGEFLGFRM